MILRGKAVSGRAAGDSATIIANGGDIRLEKMGSSGTLNASGNIELGTAGGFLKAQAGKIIRYERVGTNPTFDSLDQIVRPWAEAPPAPPPPAATKPTTIINEAEIVAAQRKAAKDRGEGI